MRQFKASKPCRCLIFLRGCLRGQGKLQLFNWAENALDTKFLGSIRPTAFCQIGSLHLPLRIILKSAKAMDPHQRYQRAMKILAACAKIGSTNLRRTSARFGSSRSILRMEVFLDIDKIKESLDQRCWTGKNTHKCLVLWLHSEQMCCTEFFAELCFV